MFRNKSKTTKYHVTTPATRVNCYELCVAAVRNSLGTAVLAKAVVQKDMNDGSIIEMLTDWKVDPIPVSLAIPLSRLRRPEVMAVTRYIVGKLKTSCDL